MSDLLSKDRTILERPFMEFRPFGADEREDNICDVSGVSVRAMVNYLEEYVSWSYGSEAGSRAVEELCRLLNERIRDSIYHVTPKFIKNTWNSYSYEFVCYVYEFCERLSGDPRFAFNAGKDKIAPVIQILGRPFPVSQIYKMFPHFGQKYTKGSIEREVCLVTDRIAILRMKFTERSYRQFGAYRNRCAQMICQSHHGSFAAVPERVHHLPPAVIKDRTCIANGDEWCEWEVTWAPKGGRGFVKTVWESVAHRAEPRLSAETDIEATASGLPASSQPTARRRTREPLKESRPEGTNWCPPALLPRDRTILEKGFMDYRPFGIDERGENIRDITGMIVRANVDYLEECAARTAAPHAATQAVRELCRLLNERIRDPAYHVTPAFLKKIWNGYSYEFVCYLREFCEKLSGDPEFAWNAGRGKKISPIFQVLGQPFSVTEIYKMYSHFAQQCASRSAVDLCVDEVTEGFAIMRLKLTEHAYRQFGPYRKRCAELACKSAKGGLSCIPEIIHQLPPAVVKDRTCIANGDEWCEWEITWTPRTSRSLIGRAWAFLSGSTPSTGADVAAMPPAAQDARPEKPPPAGPEQLTLLSKDHTILEKGRMEYRPFGMDERGAKIRDVTGIKVRAFVDYLEESAAQTQSPAAGKEAVETLCRLLNERIPDPAYHVSPKFLKNVWNSYAYEFVCFLVEFCKIISADPLFPAHAGRDKFISAVIQTLGRPFSIQQIFRMFPHFGEKFSSLILGVDYVTDRSAVLSMAYPEPISRQFGPYRYACAELICQSAKGALAAVPEKVHRLKPAIIRDRFCVARGDDRCEWELTWTTHRQQGVVATAWKWLAAIRTKRRTDEEVSPGVPSRPLTAADTRREASIQSSRGAPGSAAEHPTVDLLSKDHTILEKGCMEFLPFGINPDGTRVRDTTGVTIRAIVDYFEEVMDRTSGPGAGARATEELCRLLNERIPDSAYHVTPRFLRNVWNSYSLEFSCFTREFCRLITGDPLFSAHVGENKYISEVIQTLGRPFTVQQIYRMFPYFGEKFATSPILGVVSATDRSAILTMTYPESVYRQFGPYRKACAALICQSAKGGLAAVPEKVHHLKPALIRDVKCVANGDDRCEWELTWEPRERIGLLWWSTWLVAGGSWLLYLRIWHPELRLLDALFFSLPVALAGWLGLRLQMLQHRLYAREELIQEQLKTVDARHEELREAYLEQEQTAVELRRKVSQLTALHHAGLLFSATLDREALLRNVLEPLVRDLRYDRAMIALFDGARKVSHDARIIGVSEDIAAFVRALEIPVTDPNRPEGVVLLQGKPVLIDDLREVWDQIHPSHRELAQLTQAKAILSVPLKAKDRILGSLTVDRSQERSLTHDDLDLMVTLANQVAIALDNAEAYRQIEELNIGLENKVRERTAELQKADQLRSLFLSHVSHELRTPLTSIKGFVDNFMSGLAGPLVEKQQYYLSRIGINADRLIRLITDLLDQSRIEAGKMELQPAEVELKKCIHDVVEQLRPLAAAKQLRVEVYEPETKLSVWGDVDRLTQILTNLIHNAIKFTPDHGLIWVRACPQGTTLAGVSVKDSGPGIAQEALTRVFDPFFRLSQGRRGNPLGLGLGLSIVKTLVNLHGGTITARSEPGQGMEFHFTVPLVPNSTLLARTVGNKHILVVDDDPDIRQLLVDRLGAFGYAISASADGSTALEMLGSGSFDGMLLDIGMPDVDGLEVLRQVRERGQSLPVIVVTASGSQQRAVQAVSMGAQAYLLKPFDIVHLEQVANYWFRGTS